MTTPDFDWTDAGLTDEEAARWAEIEAWMCPRCLGNCVCADLDYAPDLVGNI